MSQPRGDGSVCVPIAQPPYCSHETLGFAALLRIKHVWGRVAAFHEHDLGTLVHPSQDAIH